MYPHDKSIKDIQMPHFRVKKTECKLCPESHSVNKCGALTQISSLALEPLMTWPTIFLLLAPSLPCLKLLLYLDGCRKSETGEQSLCLSYFYYIIISKDKALHKTYAATCIKLLNWIELINHLFNPWIFMRRISVTVTVMYDRGKMVNNMRKSLPCPPKIDILIWWHYI